MTDPSPQLVDTIAAAIADSDEYDGYWRDLTDTIGNPSPGTDTRPLAACAAMYRREARAALAAMPQPIGYAVVWEGERQRHPHIGHHSPTSLRGAMADADDYRELGTVIPTIVALVPIEAP